MNSSHPYEPPGTQKDDTPQSRFPTSLAILGFAFAGTLVLGTVNAIDEDLPPRLFLIATSGSVVSQVPGLGIAYWRWKTGSIVPTVLLGVAYLVAVTGVLAYFNYATNGKADSLHSAAHLHIVLFPLTHCFLAVCAYAVLGLTAAAISFIDFGDASHAGGGEGKSEVAVEYCSVCKADVKPDVDLRCPTCGWPV